MGKRRLNKCPKCGGRMFIDWDFYGCYEKCINCGYDKELKNIEEFIEKPIKNPINNEII